MTGVQKVVLTVVIGVPLSIAGYLIATHPRPLYRANPDGIALPPDPAMQYPDLSLLDGMEQLDITFRRGASDSLYVVATETGTTLRRYGAMEGGFIRGVLRPLDHERARHGVAADAPYQLMRDREGRLTLRDEGSNLEIEIAAFGVTSYELFASLLDGTDSPKVPALFATPASSMEDRP
jgi:putative photosynthetic complex assembly protein